MDFEMLRDRARGSLLGVAIGDAMGAPCEGQSAQVIRETYGVITGFVNDQAVGTDDTDFTLFNAWLLLTYGREITPAQVENEWRDKLLSGKYEYRPGGFSDVVSTRNLAAGLHTPQSGQFNHQMWSDGVAMAISAAGIFCPGEPDRAAALAETLGSISNARDGIEAAKAVAAAVSVGMFGASVEAMCSAALDAVRADSWTATALRRVLALDLPNMDLETALQAIEKESVVGWWPWADLVTEAVPAAFGVFHAAGGNVAKAIPAGVRLGRDADTIGAIVGSLAGVYSGADNFPTDWKRRVHTSTGKCIGFVGGQVIMEVADRLLARALEHA